MSVEDRLARLEHRIVVLEGLLRELAPHLRAAREDSAPFVEPEAGAQGVGAPPVFEPPVVPPRVSAPIPVAPSVIPAERPSGDRRSAPRFAAGEGGRSARFEEWIGQRGLLAVGVVALILAAGYLLKLSFDRGWISPPLRCLGGGVAGLVVAGIGWRLHGRYRTYGAALVGCGAAIVYLSVWAASRLFGLLPPSPATLSLAAVSLTLAAVAYRLDEEALGATAALGAFFAPLILGQPDADAGLLLVYLAAMAAALGWVAARKRWRFATLLIGVSYFGVGGAGAARGEPGLGVLAYGALGGSAGLVLGLRERWWELRFLAFWGGWGLIGMAAERLDAPLPILLGAVLMALPVWWHAFRRTAMQPSEWLYFIATPLLLAWAVERQDPELFERTPGLLAAVIAAPYLLAGYSGRRDAFALVGVAAAGLAAWLAWPGLTATWALLGLSLLWAALDHALHRQDGRFYSVATLLAALQHLYAVDFPRRGAEDAAFVGAWALALWGTTAAAAALAARLWKDGERAEENGLVRGGLWALAGALLFFGVTAELGRLFAEQPIAPASAAFANGLAVSVWWLAAGVGLAGLGARRGEKVIRMAGFASIAAAVSYLVLVDLDTRTAGDPAFWGWWSLTFWLACLVLTALAVRLSREATLRANAVPVLRAVWVVTGGFLFYGVTREIDRYFDLSAGGGSLAGGLAISIWWLLFAAALVVAGFRRSAKRVRLAGIAVAFLACSKVVLSDLATLDALYRVASVFFLGLVFLSLAYLYHRRARDEAM